MPSYKSNLDHIKSLIPDYNGDIIAVSKNRSIQDISNFISETGIKHYGENYLQEALEKWPNIKEKHPSVKLHFIGNLQSNKINTICSIFDYIHTLSSIKHAKKIKENIEKNNKSINCLIQVNLAHQETNQRSGVAVGDLGVLLEYCSEINLKIDGLMTILPLNMEKNIGFKQMVELKNCYNINHLSMGMSNDFVEASKHHASMLRIGKTLFEGF